MRNECINRSSNACIESLNTMFNLRELTYQILYLVFNHIRISNISIVKAFTNGMTTIGITTTGMTVCVISNYVHRGIRYIMPYKQPFYLLEQL